MVVYVGKTPLLAAAAASVQSFPKVVFLCHAAGRKRNMEKEREEGEKEEEEEERRTLSLKSSFAATLLSIRREF